MQWASAVLRIFLSCQAANAGILNVLKHIILYADSGCCNGLIVIANICSYSKLGVAMNVWLIIQRLKSNCSYLAREDGTVQVPFGASERASQYLPYIFISYAELDRVNALKPYKHKWIVCSRSNISLTLIFYHKSNSKRESACIVNRRRRHALNKVRVKPHCSANKPKRLNSVCISITACQKE